MQGVAEVQRVAALEQPYDPELVAASASCGPLVIVGPGRRP